MFAGEGAHAVLFPAAMSMKDEGGEDYFRGREGFPDVTLDEVNAQYLAW